MLTLPTRHLGGLETAAVGFGAMVLSPGMYGEIDDDRAVVAVQSALDEGATLIDTSDGYGADGHNERMIGAPSGAAETRPLLRPSSASGSPKAPRSTASLSPTPSASWP